MNDTKPRWKERASELEAIDSVWTGAASGSDRAEVIIRGPETKLRGDILMPGYTWIGIRLRPGTINGFSTEHFTDSFRTLCADSNGRFELEEAQMQFPALLVTSPLARLAR
jgi:hypothetical protein